MPATIGVRHVHQASLDYRIIGAGHGMKGSHVRRLLLALAAMMRLLAGLSSPETKLAPILRRFRLASPGTLSALLASSKVRPDREAGSTWKMSLGSSSPCNQTTWVKFLIADYRENGSRINIHQRQHMGQISV